MPKQTTLPLFDSPAEAPGPSFNLLVIAPVYPSQGLKVSRQMQIPFVPFSGLRLSLEKLDLLLMRVSWSPAKSMFTAEADGISERQAKLLVKQGWEAKGGKDV